MVREKGTRRLSDLWACFGRPHTIFGRVRIVEVKPHIRKGTPALAGKTP